MPFDVEQIVGRSGGGHGQSGRCAFGADAAGHQLCTRLIYIVDDAAAGFVVADVGEEVDSAAESRQPDGDDERAAADVLAGHPPIPFDDVDQRLTADQRSLRTPGGLLSSWRLLT